MLKDNHELDELFSFENNEKDIITKAKRKSTIRMTLISGLVSLLVLALIVLIKLQITPWLLDKQIIAQDFYYEVHGANLFVGPWDESIQLIGSSATAPQYKLLNGRPVYQETLSNDSHTIEIHLSPKPYETYTYLGNKVMNFIHPSSAPVKVPKELQQLDNFGDHQLIEMGLSFDQAYTLGEVQDMLPKDLSLNWAWVDAYSDQEIESIGASESQAFTENEVVGFSLVDETGVKLEKPIESFMDSMQHGKEHAGFHKKEITRLYDLLTTQQANEKNIRIIGAVVVGTKEELQQIQNESSIRTSSVGAVIDSFN